MNKNSEEMRKFSELILSALLFSGLPAAAQQADSSFTGGSAAGSGRAVVPASAEIRIPVHERVEMLLQGSVSRNPRHDLRLMFGLAPMFDGWGVDDWDDQNMGNPAYDVLHSKYSNSFFGRHCLGALSASYAYRVGEKWESGALLCALFRPAQSRSGWPEDMETPGILPERDARGALFVDLPPAVPALFGRRSGGPVGHASRFFRGRLPDGGARYGAVDLGGYHRGA